MKILLFRHAEKIFSASGNPPLSERGIRQAQKIPKLVESGKFPKPDLLLSSPKLRALQTLKPTSDFFKIEIRQMKELDERLTSENSTQYFQRVQNMIQWVGHQNRNILMVTHFDWLEEAMTAIPCDTDLSHERYHAWGSAHYMSFNLQGDLWLFNEFSGVEV